MFISCDDIDSGEATIAEKRTEYGLSRIENTDVFVTTKIFDNKRGAGDSGRRRT